jgi:hypothetical protein
LVKSSCSWSAEAAAEVAGGCWLKTALAGYHCRLQPSVLVYTCGGWAGVNAAAIPDLYSSLAPDGPSREQAQHRTTSDAADYLSGGCPWSPG